MPDVIEHCDREEWLQDRVDGDLDAAHCAALDEHLAGCSSCRARMSALREIDQALSQSLPPETLGASFDRRVLERIAAAEKTDRIAARARLERERQAQLAVLSRQWRRAWKALALNTVAGAAMLIGLAAGFGSQELVSGLTSLAGQASRLLQAAALHPVMVLLAAAGLSVGSLWLARGFGFMDWRAE